MWAWWTDRNQPNNQITAELQSFMLLRLCLIKWREPTPHKQSLISVFNLIEWDQWNMQQKEKINDRNYKLWFSSCPLIVCSHRRACWQCFLSFFLFLQSLLPLKESFPGMFLKNKPESHIWSHLSDMHISNYLLDCTGRRSCKSVIADLIADFKAAYLHTCKWGTVFWGCDVCVVSPSLVKQCFHTRCC